MKRKKKQMENRLKTSVHVKFDSGKANNKKDAIMRPISWPRIPLRVVGELI